jgi:hypothetical protein
MQSQFPGPIDPKRLAQLGDRAFKVTTVLITCRRTCRRFALAKLVREILQRGPETRRTSVPPKERKRTTVKMAKPRFNGPTERMDPGRTRSRRQTSRRHPHFQKHRQSAQIFMKAAAGHTEVGAASPAHGVHGPMAKKVPHLRGSLCISAERPSAGCTSRGVTA